MAVFLLANQIKKALQRHLHRQYTFQKPDSVVAAMKMIGIKDFWSEVAKRMPGNPKNGDLKETLTGIADRRNQIVHEADIVLKTSAKQLSTREITLSQTQDWLSWVKDFGHAISDIAS